MSLTVSVKGRQYRCYNIKGCHGYLVSECGQVICTARGRIGTHKLLVRTEPYLLKHHHDEKGFTYICLLTEAGIRRRAYVHLLLATSRQSSGNYRQKLEVNHLNGDRSDNRLSNLRITFIPVNSNTLKESEGAEWV